MKKFVEFTLENGESIVAEVESKEQEGGLEDVALDGKAAVEKAKQSFEYAMDKVKPIANAVFSRIYEGLTKPADEVGVEFAIKMNAEFGAVVADVGAEAQFRITLKWTRKEKE